MRRGTRCPASAAAATVMVLGLSGCGALDSLTGQQPGQEERDQPDQQEQAPAEGTEEPQAQQGTDPEEAADPEGEADDGAPAEREEDLDEEPAEGEVDAGDPAGHITGFEIEAEDWIEDIFAALADVTDHSAADYAEAAEDPQSFGLPAEAPDLQGYLPPGEYAFEVGAEPEDVLQAMVDRTHGRLAEAGVRDPEDQHRALIIASLIEGESQPEQYPVIAGIIENRSVPNAETDGFLQIDTTVRYGLGDMDRELTSADRADESNEYNTYQHAGLPPGPISTPTFEALRAAAEPEDSSYFYWTLVDPDTMEAKFARDYDTHLDNAQEYQEYCAENPGSC